MSAALHITVTKALALCACKDRQASECPGEWEPGCDLGNNPKHAKVTPLPLPVQAGQRFLANGTRYKVSWSDSGRYISGLPHDLNGRWVALVAADDDCHLQPAPAAQTPLPGADWTESMRAMQAGATPEQLMARGTK